MPRFLIAKLHIDLLAEQTTKKDILSALRQLPEGLNSLYEIVITRIQALKQKQRDLAMTTLKWLTYAKEPLHAGALRHALAVTQGSKKIDPEELVCIEQLVSFCVGIVAFDKNSGIIRLEHDTIREYLESVFPADQTNIEIARTCLSYLAFDVFSTACRDLGSLRDRIRNYELSSYVAFHWADHVRGGAEQHLQAVVLTTFEHYGKRDSVSQLQMAKDPWFVLDDVLTDYWVKFDSAYHRSLLHLTSSHGLSNICKTLLKKYRRGNWLRMHSNRKRLYFSGICTAD